MGDLTTLAKVKEYGGISGATSDALLSALITAASLAAERYMSRSILSASYTTVMNGNGAALLPLPQYPITVVSSVLVNNVALGINSSWGDGGFAHDGDRSIYFPGEGNRFPVGIRNITVTYTAGYTVVPPDLEQAINEMVLADFKLKDQMGWQSKMLAGESISLDLSAYSKSVRAVLDTYKNILPV